MVFGHGIWIRCLLMEILGLNKIITVNLFIENTGIANPHIT